MSWRVFPDLDRLKRSPFLKSQKTARNALPLENPE